MVKQRTAKSQKQIPIIVDSVSVESSANTTTSQHPPSLPSSSLPPTPPLGTSVYQTSSPTRSSRRIRRREDGTLISSPDPKKPTKTIYLIRHGQSCGQVAKKNGMNRNEDSRLRDCGLTPKGEQEAALIPFLLSSSALDSVELVISSPLTRALTTALIAFPKKNILVLFDLRELGSKIPENTPRSMEHVLRDVQHLWTCREERYLFDVTTLQPTDWPRDYSPTVIMKERIRKSFQWLYDQRPETIMAVVCHYNVIRSVVMDGKNLHPSNAIPIRCTLFSNGDLILDS